MSRDEIIQMAEDCGIAHRYYEIPVSKKGVVTVESCTDRLLKFAELVAERAIEEKPLVKTYCTPEVTGEVTGEVYQ